MLRGCVLTLVLCAALTLADYAMEGEEYSLKCSGTGPVQYWLLHGTGTAYRAGQTYEEDSIMVFQDGTLHFKEVVTSHEGDHLCIFTHEGTTKGQQVNMVVRPKPSDNLWQDVYKAQFITAVLSALVCAFIFTAGCLVFRFRYRAPKAVLLKGEEEGYYNPALEVDTEGSSARM